MRWATERVDLLREGHMLQRSVDVGGNPKLLERRRTFERSGRIGRRNESARCVHRRSALDKWL